MFKKGIFLLLMAATCFSYRYWGHQRRPGSLPGQRLSSQLHGCSDSGVLRDAAVHSLCTALPLWPVSPAAERRWQPEGRWAAPLSDATFAITVDPPHPFKIDESISLNMNLMWRPDLLPKWSRTRGCQFVHLPPAAGVWGPRSSADVYAFWKHGLCQSLHWQTDQSKQVLW